MPVARVKHVEDDDEGHFVGEGEVIASRDVKVLLNIDASVADPSNAARFGLKFAVFFAYDGIWFTEN
jgi:hypothetical protein